MRQKLRLWLWRVRQLRSVLRIVLRGLLAVPRRLRPGRRRLLSGLSERRRRRDVRGVLCACGLRLSSADSRLCAPGVPVSRLRDAGVQRSKEPRSREPRTGHRRFDGIQKLRPAIYLAGCGHPPHELDDSSVVSLTYRRLPHKSPNFGARRRWRSGASGQPG